MASERDVIVGVVGKPLGLKGEVFVRANPDIGHEFAAGETFRVGERQLTIAEARLHSGRQVMRFEGVDSREAAEEVRGVVLTVARDDVELDEDAFWNDELLGREVVDESGALVGVLEATMDGAAHDYLVIARPDGGEVLVPAVAELVEIGPEQIMVRAIPGLLDDDAL